MIIESIAIFFRIALYALTVGDVVRVFMTLLAQNFLLVSGLAVQWGGHGIKGTLQLATAVDGVSGGT
jgi:hypothetical protein